MTREESKGYYEAELALRGRKWTSEEAAHLRSLIDAGVAGRPDYSTLASPMRDALSDICTMLLGLERYRNMKAFPVVMTRAKKAANRAAEAIGHFRPYNDPHQL